MDLDHIDTVDELPARPRRTIPEADRELLELAARALGVVRVEDIEGEEYLILHFEDGSTANGWNPLLFSGDALELAVKLAITVERNSFMQHIVSASAGVAPEGCTEQLSDDPIAATRRAVTRMAAEIGKRAE